MKVYLDDDDEYRPTPPGWRRTHTVEETIDLLKSGRVTDLSLDNDLGEGLQEGFKVLDWMEEEIVTKGFVPPANMKVHSGNPTRKVYMRDLINRIHRLYERLHG